MFTHCTVHLLNRKERAILFSFYFVKEFKFDNFNTQICIQFFDSTIKWEIASSVAHTFKGPNGLDQSTFSKAPAIACTNKIIRTGKAIERKECLLETGFTNSNADIPWKYCKFGSRPP